MKRSLAISLSAVTLTAALSLVSANAAPGISSTDADELDISYSLLTSEFYKRVDTQKALESARTALLDALQKGGVKTPTLPPLRASVFTADDPQVVSREIAREVSAASTESGGKVGTRTLTYAAISGLLSSVNDKYTVFLNPKEYAELNEGLDGGNFSGVGISIAVDDKTKLLMVNDVIDGGPAQKSGVQPGDTIEAIDGKSTKGLTTEDDSKLLRGKEGTTVKLQIERNGADIDPITVTRAVIHQPSVYSKLLDNGIGYARLTVFGSNTAQELTNALGKLEAQGAKAYVLDLRDNGGGYLNAAIDVSSKFIASGPIVSVESRGGQSNTYDAENVAIAPKPLAVLVNKYTASASEITSGALQDDGVGELIGEKTYGKGVVQTIHPLPDGSAVKITSARYLTPKGRDINLIGITPDISLSEPKGARLGDPATDTQLQSAITYLQGRIAKLGT
jgi:carboxyl-terminal processing protease